MHIEVIDIQNFRKLKCCSIKLHEKQTVFVGANNSGKTSAMDALRFFLKEDKKITITDFTVTNWKQINKIGGVWLSPIDETQSDLSMGIWQTLVPSIDIWLNANSSELHYISHLIPTLDWEGGLLGVRLSFEPKDLEKLYKDFKEKSERAINKKAAKLQLWPHNLKDFLEKTLNDYFSITAYLLDPSLKNGIPQKLSESSSMPIDKAPFKGLFKIDIIHAQRGFSDANSDSSTNNTGGLSSQAKALFYDYLGPNESNSEDIVALSSLKNASDIFDETLEKTFAPIIKELGKIGYPGFTDPKIKMTSKIDLSDSIKHDSAIRFNPLNSKDLDEYYLPEKYNGLGYQNLISMFLSLIRFRYDWLKEKKNSTNEAEKVIEPLHIVLLEEPEAHLHVQVQQVFINKAYERLRGDSDSKNYSTQLIISTHSSHITHELDFKSLRYFKKIHSDSDMKLPCASVIDLSNVFGQDEKTSRFVAQYLKLTHCDLFFADAAIMVEGISEKMLLPAFIENLENSDLSSKYITLLEINGSYAHRFFPLLEVLGLITLIITDIDAKNDSNNKVLPERNKKYTTRNSLLKNHIPSEKELDALWDLPDAGKIKKNIRVAYQCPLNIEYTSKQSDEVIPYTFEDALVFQNIDLFKNCSHDTGAINIMKKALNQANAKEAAKEIFDNLDKIRKAELALELLFIENIKDLKVPAYINDGLKWLENTLKSVEEVIFLENSDVLQKTGVVDAVK